MKVAIITLGCKTNEYESGEIGKALNKMGYEVFYKIENADFYVLNTCSITANADAKSRQLIARVCKKNAEAKIIVCGCSAEYKKDFFEKNKNVVKVFGTDNKVQNVVSFFENQNEEKKVAKHKTRKLIKIQDGCNQFCSYCIVPYLRKRSVSRNMQEILQEINEAKEKEIVLTAINLFEFEPSLTELFKAIKNVDKRVRMGSLDPRIITKEFLEAYKNLMHPCPHFHLSVQSGCDKTLKDMNRKYLAQDVINACNLIRKYFPNAFIACDVIVGFSTETNEDFLATKQTMVACNFAFMHIFPYSVRKGTKAEKFAPLSKQILHERANALHEICEANNKNFLQKNILSNAKILLEENKNGYMVGHTENYIKCYVKTAKKSGEIVSVQIKEPIFDGMLAILLDK